MAATLYTAHETVKCPWCQKDDGTPAEDMVVQGPHHSPGKAYVNDCGWCDKLFTVTKLVDGKYEVDITSGTVDDLD